MTRIIFRGPRRTAGRWALVLLVGGCAPGGDDAVDPATVEEGEWLPGGETTNRLLLGSNAFSAPADNITPEHETAFFSGNSFFRQAWVTAPSSTTARDGLGPLFNARSCGGCHFKDGRGRPPEGGEAHLGLLLRLSRAELRGEHGEPGADPTYGGQLQPFALEGVPAEGTERIEYVEVHGTYDDGESYTLLEPTYGIDDPGYGELPDDLLISPRVAPAMIGLGLLQAIPASRLEALADPEDGDGDGISGRVQWVWDGVDMAVGRFGWKAEQPTVRHQAAGAFAGDMGVTSSVAPGPTCTPAQPDCLEQPDGGESPGAPEATDPVLDNVARYSSLLAVPVRRDWDAEDVLRGKALFRDAGCGDCHVARHETGDDPALPEVSAQVIWPYTDLLLHDMGEGLSDGRPSFGAEGEEWRTPPLWGIGLIPTVNGHDRLLHDGRARGVAEAILWHGGEGTPARDAFAAMTSRERADLVRFVESL